MTRLWMVSFMKAVLRWSEQQRVNDFKHDYGSVSKQNSKHTKIQYKWEGEDLVLDNTLVGRHRFPRINDLMPFFSFSLVVQRFLSQEIFQAVKCRLEEI